MKIAPSGFTANTPKFTSSIAAQLRSNTTTVLLSMLAVLLLIVGVLSGYIAHDFYNKDTEQGNYLSTNSQHVDNSSSFNVVDSQKIAGNLDAQKNEKSISPQQMKALVITECVAYLPNPSICSQINFKVGNIARAAVVAQTSWTYSANHKQYNLTFAASALNYKVPVIRWVIAHELSHVIESEMMHSSLEFNQMSVRAQKYFSLYDPNISANDAMETLTDCMTLMGSGYPPGKDLPSYLSQISKNISQAYRRCAPWRLILENRAYTASYQS